MGIVSGCARHESFCFVRWGGAKPDLSVQGKAVRRCSWELVRHVVVAMACTGQLLCCLVVRVGSGASRGGVAWALLVSLDGCSLVDI